MYNKDKALFITFLVCAILFLIAPERLGPLINPGQRLLYPMLFIMTGMLAGEILQVQRKYIVTCAVAIVALVITIHLSISPVSHKMEDIYCDYSSLETSNAGLYIVPVTDFEYESFDSVYPQQGLIHLLPMQCPLYRLPLYLQLNSNQYTYGLFNTGIIQSKFTTIRLISVDTIENGDYPYENVVITGYNPINHSIASLLLSNYEQLAHNEYFIYLVRRSEDR